jgi:membrane protein
VTGASDTGAPKVAAAVTTEESVGAAAADFARRLYNKVGDDDLFFLAGGVAFSILLAGVPFFLLLVAGLGYILGQSPDVSTSTTAELLATFFPTQWGDGANILDPVLHDVVRTRGAAGLYGALAFLWFSTRLFGAMRSVLVHALDVPRGHSVVWGKLFDVGLTVVAAVVAVAWVAVSAYIAIARTESVAALSRIGLHNAQVMAPVSYFLGRLLAFALLAGLFFALYKILPNRKVRWEQALVGGVTSATLFEIARAVFSFFTSKSNPATLYTGTLGAVIIAVFWVYYAAIVFVFGAEVSQVYEDRYRNKLGETLA